MPQCGRTPPQSPGSCLDRRCQPRCAQSGTVRLEARHVPETVWHSTMAYHRGTVPWRITVCDDDSDSPAMHINTDLVLSAVQAGTRVLSNAQPCIIQHHVGTYRVVVCFHRTPHTHCATVDEKRAVSINVAPLLAQLHRSWFLEHGFHGQPSPMECSIPHLLPLER